MKSSVTRVGVGKLVTVWPGIARLETAKHNFAVAAVPPRLAGAPTPPGEKPRTVLVVRKGQMQ